jgi:acetyl-CoA synthetase
MTGNTAAYRAARDQLVDQATDYAKACDTFHWPTLTGRWNWATDWFDEIASDNQRTALWLVEEDGTERKYSFAELSRRSDQIATWLQGLGVTMGDRVILMLGNQVELWESMLAVAKLGGVIMPTTAALGTADLIDRIARGKARFVVANTTDAAKFAEVPGDYGRIVVGKPVPGWHHYADAAEVTSAGAFEAVTAPHDPLLVYFTSGTTSKPKLVQHTQVSYPVGHLSTMYWVGVRPGDVHLTISSPGWAKHAWSLFFTPWIAEATVFVYNYGRFDAAALVAHIRRAGVNTFCAPPTVWRMLIQADLGARPDGLREVLAAGEPLNPEVIAQVEQAWDLTIRDGFGQTETTAQVGNTPAQPVRAGSMGRPLPGYSVVLVDPVSGEPGRDGEICLDLSRRPLGLMTGYLDDDSLNARAMAGGYYHTGDVATSDDDGYITYVGRTDDVFKASDYRISPFELESVLIEHEAVAEAAVVPSPDPVRLAVPKAYVLLAGGRVASPELAQSIMAFCRERVAPYKRIRRVEFGDLPKTISGKIRRVELRGLETSRPSSARGVTEFWEEDFTW